MRQEGLCVVLRIEVASEEQLLADLDGHRGRRYIEKEFCIKGIMNKIHFLADPKRKNMYKKTPHAHPLTCGVF